MKENFLVGAWNLISWTLTDKEGQIKYPYGKDAQGYLIYTPTKLISVHLMKANRKTFESNGTFDATPEQALDCYQDYASYCGTYEVADDKVIHHVLMCTNPNWNNSTQERQFKIKDNLLHLSHPFEQCHSQLIWKKA